MSDNSDAAASPLLSGVLLALAERCEREMPSGNLDRGIHLGLHGLTAEEAADRWMPSSIERNIPAYTSSLDAAATLELPGFYLTVVSGKGQPCAACWLDAESGVQFNGEAKSEPMARCAAALRACAAIAKATGGDQ